MIEASLTLIDGQAGDRISVRDRGLMYGDGVFRTLRVVAGQPRWWEEHLAKLANDCARLAIPAPDPQRWSSDLAALAVQMTDGILKLVVTRGDGPRGYAPLEPAFPRRMMQYTPTDPTRADTPAGIPVEGASLRVCDLRLGHQPRLAGVKHLNRLENVLARMEWNAPDIHEGLLLDQEGRVISGVMSNLFLWRDGALATPRLNRCGVAGVARARLMRLAAAQDIGVTEADLTLDDVLAADEVMLTNSVMGLRRVHRLADRVWPVPVISPKLAALLEA